MEKREKENIQRKITDNLSLIPKNNKSSHEEKRKEGEKSSCTKQKENCVRDGTIKRGREERLAT